MKTYRQIIEAEKIKKPKQWVADYLENMIDNGDIEAYEFKELMYKTWKDFFQAAVNGAYDWSEDLEGPSKSHEEQAKVDKIRNGIKKVKDSGFAADKKTFKQVRAEMGK